MLQERLNTPGIEQAARIPHPGAGSSQPKQSPPPIRVVAASRDQPESDEATELERDGAGGDAQPAGQLARGGRTDRIEVLQNAGQVGAQPDPGAGFMDRTAPAGGEHQGNRAHHPPGRAGRERGHGPQAGEDSLVCQIKLIA